MIEAAVLVVLAVIGAVILALAHWRKDDPRTATMESGQSHMRGKKP